MNDVSLIGCFFTLGVGAYPHTEREYCPHDFRTRVETAAAAGYTGMGFYHSDLVHILKTYSLKEMKRILDDNRIVNIELEWLLDWYYTDNRRKKSDEVRSLLLSAAETLRARYIKIGDLGNDGAGLQQLIDAFGVLCGEAAQRGTRVLFELLPADFTRFPTLEGVLQLTRGAGAPNGGIMLDSWHLTRTRTSNAMLEALLRPDDVIGVEINDGLLADPVDPADAVINRRLLVGRGEFDLIGLVTSLNRIGYRGPYGVEILSAELRECSLAEAARASYETTMAMFAKVQTEPRLSAAL